MTGRPAPAVTGMVCEICGEPITAGEYIVVDDDTAAAHAACLDAEQQREADDIWERERKAQARLDTTAMLNEGRLQ